MNHLTQNLGGDPVFPVLGKYIDSLSFFFCLASVSNILLSVCENSNSMNLNLHVAYLPTFCIVLLEQFSDVLVRA